jgi:DNA replication protein DnaC
MTKWEEELAKCQIPKNLMHVTMQNSKAIKAKLIAFGMNAQKPTNPNDTISKQATNAIKTFSDGFLTLSGPVGTGKTHFSVCIAKKRIREVIEEIKVKPSRAFREAPIWFKESVEMLREIRQDYDDKRSANLEFYKRHPFLVIDDLGSEKETEWTREAIYTIINYRYSNSLTTIITTNASELQDKIKSRVRSGIVIEFKGEDRRGK